MKGFFVSPERIDPVFRSWLRRVSEITEFSFKSVLIYPRESEILKTTRCSSGYEEEI